MLKMDSPSTSSPLERELAAQEMRRELEILKSIRHENVVRVKGVLPSYQGDCRVIIVMEFVREGSLDRYLHVNRDKIRYPKQVSPRKHLL